MSNLLEIDRLVGGYSMQRPVLHELSFQIKPGEMVGLLGLNGAGKSTTIKHILGLMKPHSGTVKVEGKTIDEDRDAYRAAFAYVPETPLLFEELTVEEHLKLTAMAYGIDEKDYKTRTEELMEEFNMTEKRKQFAAHLSKGMKQKLMIMNAFLVRPKLYIIDEPFLGLDPLGIRSLLDLMGKMQAQGASILMSTHILSMIEHYCQRFVILHQGKIAAQGNLVELREAAGTNSERLDDLFFDLVKGGNA